MKSARIRTTPGSLISGPASSARPANSARSNAETRPWQVNSTPSMRNVIPSVETSWSAPGAGALEYDRTRSGDGPVRGGPCLRRRLLMCAGSLPA